MEYFIRYVRPLQLERSNKARRFYRITATAIVATFCIIRSCTFFAPRRVIFRPPRPEVSNEHREVQSAVQPAFSTARTNLLSRKIALQK